MLGKRFDAVKAWVRARDGRFIRVIDRVGQAVESYEENPPPNRTKTTGLLACASLVPATTWLCVLIAGAATQTTSVVVFAASSSMFLFWLIAYMRQPDAYAVRQADPPEGFRYDPNRTHSVGTVMENLRVYEPELPILVQAPGGGYDSIEIDVGMLVAAPDGLPSDAGRFVRGESEADQAQFGAVLLVGDPDAHITAEEFVEVSERLDREPHPCGESDL